MATTYLFSDVFEKHKIFKKIERIIFENDGIIYGGYARDHVLREHNMCVFKKTEHKFLDEWDISIDPDTKDRCLLSRDMDIKFDCDTDKNLFVQDVEDELDCNLEKICDNTYANGAGQKYKINYKNRLGPIKFEMEILMDIHVRKLDPPRHCDFITNCLILSGKGLRLSTFCGVNSIDTKTGYSRLKATNYVCDLIIRKETYCCLSHIGEPELLRIIKKMRLGYRILNAGFYENCQTDEKCLICYEASSEYKFELSYMCKECFPKYLEERSTKDGSHIKCQMNTEHKIKFDPMPE
jgi:hypothetical protein